jgi:hypothetical protein
VDADCIFLDVGYDAIPLFEVMFACTYDGLMKVLLLALPWLLKLFIIELMKGEFERELLPPAFPLGWLTPRLLLLFVPKFATYIFF